MTPPPEAQLGWLTIALEELPAFLSSPNAFRPLHAPSLAISEDLSLGRLLLAVDALQASEGDLRSADRARWDSCRVRWEKERSARPAGIEAKARTELPQRLNVWRAYLQDLAEKAAEAAAYPIEVRHRVIAARLIEVLGGRYDDRLVAQLATADEALRPRLEAAPFQWAPVLAPLYPPKEFWFLYGRPAIPS